jgi:MFS family permease
MTARARLACLLCISFATQFAVMFDVAIMDVALPTVGRDLGLRDASLTWAVNAYVTALAGLLLAGGRIVDLIGCRRALRLGGVIFGLAGLASLLAPTAGWFLAARALQGAGAALLLPAALTVVSAASAEWAGRARALAWWSAVAELGALAGILLTGALTQYASWRLVYGMDVALATGIVATASAAPEGRRIRRPPPDALAAFTATASLVAFLSAVVQSSRGILTVQFAGTALVALLLGSLFAIRERRVAAPLLPRSVFRDRPLLAANAGVGLVSAAAFGLWFVLAIELQDHRGLGPLAASAAMLPLSAGMLTGTWLGARALLRAGVIPTVAGAGALASVGLVALALLHGPYAEAVMLPLFIATLGIGAALVPLTVTATADPPPQSEGVVSGMLNTSRQVGGAIGVAVLGSLLAGPGTLAALAAGAAMLVLAAAPLALVEWRSDARRGRTRRHWRAAAGQA